MGRSSGPVTCVASYDGGFARLNKSCALAGVHRTVHPEA